MISFFRTGALSLVLFAVHSCTVRSKQADLLVYNATIYTVDSAFTVAEALVIRDGRILATGKKSDLEKKYRPRELKDAGGGFIYPGFIDAHAHFAGYGKALFTVDLTGTGSWKDCIARVKAFADRNGVPAGEWVLGRGWDQNDWTDRAFPDRSQLDSLFPDHPILLSRVDGHAAIANRRALDLAGLQPGLRLTGGAAEERNGELTGLLIDNAVDLVAGKVPPLTEASMKKALLAAERNCFAAGLTSVSDCGLSIGDAELIRTMQAEGALKMRLYVMLSDHPSSFAWAEKNGIIRTNRLHIRSIKMYGDGALGSRGACLLRPYSDQSGHHGFLLSTPEHFDSVAAWSVRNDYQLCTHAIGDSGNRTILRIYERHLQPGNQRRWRIEHAQVVAPEDFNRFGRYSIIPSVQPTHATSDMYWAGDRLGAAREKGAYAYRQLLEENGWIPLGTDFPVEDIVPLKTFYAAVVRQDASGYPNGGYQPENALTREQALRGMTCWAARAQFEEADKGSLEQGKWADFVVLDRDLMKEPAAGILQTNVLMTFQNGVAVFKK